MSGSANDPKQPNLDGPSENVLTIHPDASEREDVPEWLVETSAVFPTQRDIKAGEVAANPPETERKETSANEDGSSLSLDPTLQLALAATINLCKVVLKGGGGKSHPSRNLIHAFDELVSLVGPVGNLTDNSNEEDKFSAVGRIPSKGDSNGQSVLGKPRQSMLQSRIAFTRSVKNEGGSGRGQEEKNDGSSKDSLGMGEVTRHPPRKLEVRRNSKQPHQLEEISKLQPDALISIDTAQTCKNLDKIDESLDNNTKKDSPKHIDVEKGGKRATFSIPFKQRKITDEWVEMAHQAFKLIDKNGDGFLQKEEVMRAIVELKSNGIDLGIKNAEMAEVMMKEVDIDGDGQIDMDEFIQMMSKSSQEDSGATASTNNHRMSMLAKNVILAHKKSLEENVIGADFWMIHPHDWKNSTWDVTVSILITITVVTMPLCLGWEEINETLYGMNLTFDIIFLLDVVKNFCTGLINENDAVVMDAKTVHWNYLTGFFVTDFVSSIPVDMIILLSGAENFDNDSTVTGTKQTLRMLKLLKMTKLFKILRISSLFQYIKYASMWMEDTLNIRVSIGFTKLLRLAVGALFLAHWIGCFNFYLVRQHNFPDDSWVVYAGLQNLSWSTQWSWSFFKALSQMIMIGFETPPFTNGSCDTASDWCGIEMWITLACLYVGAVFYSLLISSIATILQTANLSSRRFEEQLLLMDDYMRSKRLPTNLRERVKEYFHLQHSDGKLFNEDEVLNLVTPSLRREIEYIIGKGVLRKVPILSAPSNNFFADEIAMCIEPTITFSDEIVIKQNSIGHSMFFIHSGVVEVLSDKSPLVPHVTVGDGCYFGDVSLLLSVRRTASVRTKTRCMFYIITQDKLLAVLNNFPDILNSMRKVARSRQRRLLHFEDPSIYLDPKDAVDPEDSRTDLFDIDTESVTQLRQTDDQKNRRHTRYNF